MLETNEFSAEQRFELLKVEMELLQSRFDKYDDLIFKTRNLLTVLMTALYSFGITQYEASLLALGVCLAPASWLLEVVWRAEFWYQYVQRYRHIRNSLNEGSRAQSLALYDLSNHYGSKVTNIQKFRACASNLEPAIFYSFWFVLGVSLYFWL